MPRRTPTPRQAQIDAAILQALHTQPRPTYRSLAAAAQTSTGQVRASWARLAAEGLAVPPGADIAELAGYAAGWDACVALLGNVET